MPIEQKECAGNCISAEFVVIPMGGELALRLANCKRHGYISDQRLKNNNTESGASVAKLADNTFASQEKARRRISVACLNLCAECPLYHEEWGDSDGGAIPTSEVQDFLSHTAGS